MWCNIVIVININIVDHRSHLSQSPVRQTMSSFPMLVTYFMIMIMMMMMIMMLVTCLRFLLFWSARGLRQNRYCQLSPDCNTAYHTSRVTCNMSHVAYHTSCVTCNMSPQPHSPADTGPWPPAPCPPSLSRSGQ